MRETRALGPLLVCVALAASAVAAPAPDGTQNTGTSPSMEPDASQPELDPAPVAGEVADPDCELARGVFEPLYTLRSGDCGPLVDANYVSL